MVKISDKNFCKKFLGLGCCDKTASENDFNVSKEKCSMLSEQNSRDIIFQHILHPKNESFYQLFKIRKGTFGRN